MQLTPEQETIIGLPAGNLLISAAAGSGKTRVLTDRIVRRIIDGQLDVRAVLVVTFTEAAARNMKDKIHAKLQAALEEAASPVARHHLSRQLSLLPGAAISTIHAFCLDVIRSFYYCAKDDQGQPLIEPGFGIDNDVETDLLLRETLDEWMNSQYEAIDLAEDNPPDDPAEIARLAAGREAFYRLVEGYGGSGGDQPVRELLLGLYRFLRSLPDYAGFVQSRLDDLEAAAADFPASRHLTVLLRQLRLRLDRALSQMDELEGLLSGNIRFIAAADRNQEYRRQFLAVLQALRSLDAYLAAGGRDWDQIRTLAGCLTSIELPRTNRSDSPEKIRFMDLFCQTVAEAVFFLAGGCGSKKCSQHFIFDTPYVFCQSAAGIEADITAMLPSVRLFFDWTLGLDREYARKKRAAGIIDFSDFEHLALAILRQEEASQYYRSRFQEIYVDEYQDTSSIQEAIIQSVSAGNCLMVGDVKQSIYRFRHARPRLFLERAAAYSAGRDGMLCGLNRNFRSVSGILAAVNDLFGQLMSTGAGEIEYDASQSLAPHRPDDPDQPPVSLLLLNRSSPYSPEMEGTDLADAGQIGTDQPQTGDEQPGDVLDFPAAELNREHQEALLVVRQMLLLHAQGHAWNEMAVLGRTHSIGEAYRDQLENYGIPVAADTSGNYPDTPVLRLMEALIHLLDNIRQDIPLAAVLKSDLHQGGFTPEELVRVRLQARCLCPDSRFFHEAILAYAADGPDQCLRRRLQDFLKWLDHLRTNEQIMSLSELIGLIYAETGWLDRLAARADGSVQIRWLRQFRQWAEQFESRRQRGLYAFARYLESMRSRGGLDLPPAAAESDQDAVRVMTIHGSKGLEFPIVFLVGTGYGLRPRDSQDSILLSESLGIGLDFADPERQVRYPTHLKLAMLEEIKAAAQAEELRLLYVAMTRAMDRLFLAGTVRLRPGQGDSRLGLLLEQARQISSRQLPDYLVLSCRSYLEWLILALARQPDPDLSWLTGGLTVAADPNTSQSIWQVELFQIQELQQELAGLSTDQPALADQTTSFDQCLAGSRDIYGQEGLLALARQRIAAPYRFEAAARIPVKVTVSELKHQEHSAVVQREEDGVRQPIAFDASLLAGHAPRGIGLAMHGWPESEAEPGQKTEPVFEPDLFAVPAVEPESAPGNESDSAPAARIGTLLHLLLRYLDLPAARLNPTVPEIDRQIADLSTAGIFSPGDIEAVQSYRERILAFVRSGLAGDMAGAYGDPRRPIYQEMPFTLAVPACQVHPDCPGLSPDDRVLIQGIIDCWFEDAGGVTLVDYKSDRLNGNDQECLAELRRRYSLQLEYYARAIQAATGKTVRRRLVWLIRRAQAFDLAPSAAD